MMNMVRNFPKGEEKKLKWAISGGEDFNLSRNKSIRTLETTSDSTIPEYTDISDFFKTVLSSITSPALLDVVIVYRELEFGEVVHHLSCTDLGPRHFPHHFRMSVSMAQHCRQQFEVFKEMQKVRDFRLVLCADVFDRMVESAIEMLEDLVKEEKEKGGLDSLLHQPLIISERRTPHTRCTDFHVGCPLDMLMCASAL